MAKLGGCKAKGKDHTIRSPLHFNRNVVYKVLCKNPLWVISRRKCLFFEREKCIHSKGWPSHFWQTENHPLKGVPFLVCTRRYEKFKLEKPVTTIGHSQSNTKNTTNKNRFFLFETHFKGETFLDQKKRRQQQIFLQTKHWELRLAKDLQTTFNPSASHPAG